MKRRAITCLAALLAVCSCEDVDFGNRGLTSTVSETPKTVVDTLEGILMSAVIYPDGYDWTKDEGLGDGECTIAMMTEDSVLFSHPIGEEYESSGDSDMHRILGNCLYEDWSSEEEKIVKKNGEEVFRVEGREMISDMVLRDGSLYTLGAPRSKGGYVLRKDGKVLSQSPDVLPVGGFYTDSGDLCFTGVSKENGRNSWSIVREGRPTAVAHPSDEADITAIKAVQGKTVMILQAGDYLFQTEDKDLYVINIDFTRDFRPIEIMDDGEKWLADCCEYEADSVANYQVWNKGNLLFSYKGNFEKASWTMEDGILYVLGHDRARDVWILLRDGGVATLPEGYRPHSSHAMLLREGSLTLSLVDSENKAALWKDGIVKSLGFNGYVDHITYGKFTSTRYVTGRH